jgi:hypothetical protein
MEIKKERYRKDGKERQRENVCVCECVRERGCVRTCVLVYTCVNTKETGRRRNEKDAKMRDGEEKVKKRDKRERKKAEMDKGKNIIGREERENEGGHLKENAKIMKKIQIAHKHNFLFGV